jgi:DNA-binding transcriptional MerR regulator
MKQAPHAKPPLMTGAVSQILGYSDTTIYKLEAAGQLVPFARTATGLRLYDPDVVEAFALARRRKRAARPRGPRP